MDLASGTALGSFQGFPPGAMGPTTAIEAVWLPLDPVAPKQGTIQPRQVSDVRKKVGVEGGLSPEKSSFEVFKDIVPADPRLNPE